MLETLRLRRLLDPDASVLVALSGGADSTALLAALARLAEAGHLAEVAACHVDHGLRPGSAADAVTCEGLARRLAVPIACRRVWVAPGNVQAQARRARYAALLAVAGERGASHVATGHTRTDQAETVLLRLLRGAGARGLGGIPPRRGRGATVVRPLLDRSRAEVEAYLAERGLPWLDDPSNATGSYLRNRLRRELWPALLALAPAAERALARSADLLRDDDRALEARARRLAPRRDRAESAALRKAPAALRRRVLRRLWWGATGSRRGLEAHHVESILALLDGRGRGRISLPGGLEARVGRAWVEIGPPPEQAGAAARE